MAARTLIFDSSAFISNARMYNSEEGHYYGVLDGSSEAYAVPELTLEVRDALSRERLDMIIDKINFVEPTVESLNFVKSFSRETGDFHALSLVDMKVIALTYQVEVERHGKKNIKPEPKALEYKLIHHRHKKRNQKSSDPKEEPEEVDEDGWQTVKSKGSRSSKFDSVPEQISVTGTNQGKESKAIDGLVLDLQSELRDLVVSEHKLAEEREKERILARLAAEESDGTERLGPDGNHVQDAASGSIGSRDRVDEDGLDDEPEDEQSNIDEKGSEEEEFEYASGDLEYDEVSGDEEEQDGVAQEETSGDLAGTVHEAEQAEEEEEEEEVDDDGSGWINPDNLKTELEKDLGMTESEEKTYLVGCVTTDYSMQNVLLQMGLELLSVDGQKVVKHIRRYILRCSCCTTLTRELHRQFCPGCGNHTLVRLPFSIDKKGVARVYYDPNRHPSLRGIKYPIPKPKGGRNNTDLILTEDQLRERRRQLPRRKKKVVDVFDPNTKYNPGARPLEDRRLIVGYGRRNPNAVNQNPKRNR
ncbi:hypothetical protein NDN08_002837 [Rhodosorus marinus]|uniref:RNA-binding protein NOB1 n=1 Tax=Rhodosorus marinus TaxID=101924 RepID=A0AAV8UUY4_9RHOD|nr:hypothetical protein NDN08_002837 [Rhodosorus marinus]